MFKRLISLTITIAFIFTQCGLGIAAEKMGTDTDNINGVCPHFLKNTCVRIVEYENE